MLWLKKKKKSLDETAPHNQQEITSQILNKDRDAMLTPTVHVQQLQSELGWKNSH